MSIIKKYKAGFSLMGLSFILTIVDGFVFGWYWLPTSAIEIVIEALILVIFFMGFLLYKWEYYKYN